MYFFATRMARHNAFKYYGLDKIFPPKGYVDSLLSRD